MTKICDILWGQALRAKDDKGVEDAKVFQKLYKKEWHIKISSQTLKNMKEKTLKKSKELPLTEDVNKLSKASARSLPLGWLLPCLLAVETGFTGEAEARMEGKGFWWPSKEKFQTLTWCLAPSGLSLECSRAIPATMGVG